MKRIIIIPVIQLLVFLSGFSQPVVPVRAWQFHELDMDYVSKTLKKAPEYDINTVVFSHGMIDHVSQLYNEPDRAEKLVQLSKEAHELDFSVWIWIHELENDVPEKYVEGDKVFMDRPGFWKWLEKKYEKLFIDFPDFDGILLTFHETRFKLFSNDEVISGLSMPDRFAKMINTINKACKKYNKDFVVRSFLYEPQEIEWFAEGLKKVDERVMLQSKCVPHDWQPYYPHNYMIGKFPDRKLIVEFDASSEFTGRNNIPYTSPEYFRYRWIYDLQQPGVTGYNVRLDHDGYDAVYTPNEINLYTLYRLTNDTSLTADQIWKEWTESRYGENAASLVKKALKPSFSVVNNSFFVHQFWITNHSRLPDFDYANGHIRIRTIAKWKPDHPELKRIEEELFHPDASTLEWILTEKDSAIAWAEESLEYLRQAKPYLKSNDYDELYWRLSLLHRVAIVWKYHAEAFFGYKVLIEGHDVPGLKERVERAINALFLQAEVSAKNPQIGNDPPASADEIRNVASELEVLLKNNIP